MLAVLSGGWLVALPGDRTDSTAIVHLRTGRTIGAAWLELARTLAEYEPSDRPELAGIVHVPRVRIDRECKGTMSMRDGLELVGEWRSWERRVQAVLSQGSTPLARPGQHCQRCRLACGVRRTPIASARSKPYGIVDNTTRETCEGCRFRNERCRVA